MIVARLEVLSDGGQVLFDVGPAVIILARSSGLTNWDAASNPFTEGISLITLQPKAENRKRSCAIARASSFDGP